jgi:hypothetical protein
VWVGFTGVRGGQRVTTGEFDDFSYRRHSATVATPYRRGSSARHGEKYNNQLATVAMDGAMATRRQRQWTTGRRLQCNGNWAATEDGRCRQQRGSKDKDDKDDNDGGGGGGDGHRRRSGHSSRDDRNGGNDGNSDDNDLTECL